LTALEEISILPDWPTTFHPLVDYIVPFPFGLQLMRTQKPIKSLTYGLPLDATTNSVSRQQLRTLSPPRLKLTFARPTLALFEELRELVVESTDVLAIRYVTTRLSIEPGLLLCEPLQAFKKVELHLHLPRPERTLHTPFGPRLIVDPDSPTTTFIARLISAIEAMDEDVQERYTVYNVQGWELTNGMQEKTVLWPPPSVAMNASGVTGATREMEDELKRIQYGTETDTEHPAAGSSGSGENKEKAVVLGNGRSSTVATSEAKRSSDKSQWERQTNLKLLGGFIGLSLESKKY
jgi:hypothetical protein